MHGLLIIAIVIFLSWIASSWPLHQQLLNTNESTYRWSSDEAEGNIQPELAAKFIHWWLPRALNYSSTGPRLRADSSEKWMFPAAQRKFDQMFWTNAEVEKSSFELIDFSKPVLKDNLVFVSARGRWKYEKNEMNYLEIKLNFKLDKAPTGYRIVDWSIERGNLIYYVLIRRPNTEPAEYEYKTVFKN